MTNPNLNIESSTRKEKEDDLHSSSKKESVFQHEIRIDLIFRSIKKNWRKYIVPMCVTMVLTAVIVFSMPRYYSVKVMLAPESNGGASGMSGLGSLASMAGINLSSLNSEDAIIPMFYPDLMKSTDFIVSLLDTQVETSKGTFKGCYADYLTKACKATWWDMLFAKTKNAISSEKREDLPRDKTGNLSINPFKLTKKQDEIVRAARGSLSCSVDKKTDVITITTTAQDPMVAALLADSVMQDLQDFIINYRTKKAKNDLAHYQNLLEQASKAYEKKQQEYAAYADANQDVILASYKVKEEKLENELQLAFNTYSQLRTQVQLAESKVMERTPAFTVLQNASVPVKPTGPKRMITMAAMLLLCFIAVSARIIISDNSLNL